MEHTSKIPSCRSRGRVDPHLQKSLRPRIETLTRPKRSPIVDVPIRLDNGEIAGARGLLAGPPRRRHR